MSIVNRIKKRIKSIKTKIKNLQWHHLVNNDLLVMQETDKFLGYQYVNGNFNRFDTIVRYLAVENFYHKNDYGFELYRKMQDKRGFIEGAEAKFKDLIVSIEKNGFSIYSPLPVSRNQALIDGSHRLAIALYFNQTILPIRRSLFNYSIFYGIDWFIKNNFSDKEIKLITDKKKEIFYNKGLYFQVILWPPMKNYFSEIEKSISQEYRVLNSYTKSVESNLKESIFDIYKSDNIEDWKIEKKIEGFENYSKEIRIIEIEIPNPRFRRKSSTNQDISREVEAIKRKYRNKYKHIIPNYFKDTIIHIGDNYYQTKEIAKSLDKLKTI